MFGSDLGPSRIPKMLDFLAEIGRALILPVCVTKQKRFYKERSLVRHSVPLAPKVAQFFTLSHSRRQWDWTGGIMFISLFLVFFSFTCLFIPCGRLSWLIPSAFYCTLNTDYRIVSHRVLFPISLLSTSFPVSSFRSLQMIILLHCLLD